MQFDQLPKNGQLQKGQTLSLYFFEQQIDKNLENILRNIRDHIDFESKRKGRRSQILRQEQYLKMVYDAYSFDYQCKAFTQGLSQNQPEQRQEKIYNFITDTFIAHNPIFYEPKWKIFFQGQQELRTLAILNHLAYGYFYQQNEQGDLVSVLSIDLQSKMQMTCTLRQQFQNLRIGTAKQLLTKNKNQNCFTFVDFIHYKNQEQEEEEFVRQASNPRLSFKVQQIQVDAKMCKIKGNQKNVYMTLQKLKTKKDVMVDAFNCQKYDIAKVDYKKIEDFTFGISRYFWSSSKNLSVQNSQMENYNQVQQTKKQQQERIHFMKQHLITFQNSSKLVQFLQKIPNFAYHLSNQEKQIIQINGNIIVIGRSGTGKTTCALLRLFSLQTLFKIKSIKMQQTQRDFSSKDLEQDSKMKNIFLTASPFLIEQLKKNYIDHFINVKFQLEKKQNKNKFLQNHRIRVENEDINNLDELKKVQNKIKEVNQRMRSLNYLSAFDFPGFFTLKNFLIMIDGIYHQNFFKRGKNKQLFRQQNVMKLNLNHEVLYIKNQLGQYDKSSQIDYDYFREYFWGNEIIKRKDLKCNLNQMTVWTEIFSTIEGSTQSHKCPHSYISEEMYISQSKNKFLTEVEKREVYYIFKLYYKWKKNLNRYDLMDLTNFLLRKILKNSYLGPTLNFLFIDQVQDLTPATIFLVSQIIQNNIFYAGDTAQSISKGVIFKFSDVKLLFKPQFTDQYIPKEEPIVKQLTVNFRSHDKILKVANSIIKIIQILFPKTIDILRKQTSTIQGPKPVFISGPQDVIRIFQKKNQPGRVMFNSKQAIIIRNEQDKKQTQELFKDAIVLTITQCKGLQFQDVILWKLMDGCKCEKLWKILDTLVIQRDQTALTEKKKQQYNFIDVQDGAQYDQIQQVLTASQKLKEYNLNDYYELCSELKLLYTAATRAKQILVFYRSIPQRLSNIFEQLNLTDRVSEQYVKQVQEYKLLKKEKMNGMIQQKQMEVNQWRAAGIQFYKKQNYGQAWNCFNNIHDEITCKRIQAKMQLKEAEKSQQRFNISMKMGKYNTQQEITKQQKLIKQAFFAAGAMYQQNKLYQEAGFIYYQVKDYKLALKCFTQMNMFAQMGQCLQSLQQYTNAAQLFQKAKMFQRMLKCLIAQNRTIMVLIKLIQNQEKFNDYQTKKRQFKQQIIFNVEKQLLKIQGKQFKSMMRKNDQKAKNAYLSSRKNKSVYYKTQIQKIRKKNIQCQFLKSIKKIDCENFQDQLRIALFFDKQDSKNFSIQSYLHTPINVKNMIDQMESLGRYELCFMLCGAYRQLNHIQDYLSVMLFQKYYTYTLAQFQFSLKKLIKIKNIPQKYSKMQINNEIQRLNFQEVLKFQQNFNPSIINNIVHSLILSGFFQSSQIFFKNQSLLEFYLIFFRQQQFFYFIYKKNYREAKIKQQEKKNSTNQQKKGRNNKVIYKEKKQQKQQQKQKQIKGIQQERQTKAVQSQKQKQIKVLQSQKQIKALQSDEDAPKQYNNLRPFEYMQRQQWWNAFKNDKKLNQKYITYSLQLLYKKYDQLQINRLFYNDRIIPMGQCLNQQNRKTFGRSVNSIVKKYTEQKNFIQKQIQAFYDKKRIKQIQFQQFNLQTDEQIIAVNDSIWSKLKQFDEIEYNKQKLQENLQFFQNCTLKSNNQENIQKNQLQRTDIGEKKQQDKQQLPIPQNKQLISQLTQNEQNTFNQKQLNNQKAQVSDVQKKTVQCQQKRKKEESSDEDEEQPEQTGTKLTTNNLQQKKVNKKKKKNNKNKAKNKNKKLESMMPPPIIQNQVLQKKINTDINNNQQVKTEGRQAENQKQQQKIGIQEPPNPFQPKQAGKVDDENNDWDIQKQQTSNNNENKNKNKNKKKKKKKKPQINTQNQITEQIKTHDKQKQSKSLKNNQNSINSKEADKQAVKSQNTKQEKNKKQQKKQTTKKTKKKNKIKYKQKYVQNKDCINIEQEESQNQQATQLRQQIFESQNHMQSLKKQIQQLRNSNNYLKQNRQKKTQKFTQQVKGLQVPFQRQLETIDRLNSKLTNYQKGRHLYKQKYQNQIQIQFQQNLMLQRQKKIPRARLNQVSYFLQSFYKNNQLQKQHIEKIIEFDIQQTRFLKIIQIITFGLAILSDHQDVLRCLDQFTNVRSSAKRFKKYFRIIRQNKLYQNQSDGDVEHSNQEKIIIIKNHFEKKLSSYFTKIQTFFAKFVFILQNSFINEGFFKILLGFLQCKSFTKSDHFSFLQQFIIVKSQMAQRLNLVAQNIKEQFSYFDQNGEFLICSSKVYSQQLTVFIKKSFQKVFISQLSQLNDMKFELKQKLKPFSQPCPQQFQGRIQDIEVKMNNSSRKIARSVHQIFFMKENSQNQKIKLECSKFLELIRSISHSQKYIKHCQFSKTCVYQQIKQFKLKIIEQQTRKKIEQEQQQKRKAQEQEQQRRMLEQQEKRKNQATCSICLQEFLNLILQCKHQFHLKCIMDHLKMGRNKNCPFCRKNLLYQKAIGICESCNDQKVEFIICNHYAKQQQDENSLFCTKCTQKYSQRPKIDNIYEYFKVKY